MSRLGRKTRNSLARSTRSLVARIELSSFEFLINEPARLINKPARASLRAARKPKQAKIIDMTTTTIGPYISQLSPIQIKADHIFLCLWPNTIKH